MAPKTESKGKKPSSKSAKAGQAAKAALKGSNASKQRKVRLNTRFRQPKTLSLPRTGLYSRRSVNRENKLSAQNILLYPSNSEHSMKKIEEHNTLVFFCNVKANKPQIKQALKELYDVDTVKINTLITPEGQKKAYARLTPDQDALDVAATKLSIV